MERKFRATRDPETRILCCVEVSLFSQEFRQQNVIGLFLLVRSVPIILHI